ncbi:hypothetical protein [Effusibacillus pohliae]|uniref:hypothetical protein n=1 Tax=Effusibacillus pohliae TaxID=232270 RepID=UPI0003614F82|nr:hypothetical protein [Effusibacillus pohliae]
MRASKLLKNIWARMAANRQELEVSEELTNAYFGDQAAWQVNNTAEQTEVTPSEKPDPDTQ